MARYTETVVAAVRQRYEDTDQTIHSIAAEFGIGSRSVSRLAVERGWQKRSERVHDLPVPMRLLAEAKALVSQPGHSRESGNPVIADAGKSEPPGVLGPRFRGDDTTERGDERENLSAIDRLEALVLKAIETEEATRSLYAGKRRAATASERSARTLATLTQTLQALQRMRAGASPETETFHDDDMPRDIDEFRHALARRIEAFVASHVDDEDADENSGPAMLDAAG